MKIVVSFKRIYGKDLFYPVSEDAHFLARLTGRPTILKHQLKMCIDRGWHVKLEQEQINLEEYLNKDGE